MFKAPKSAPQPKPAKPNKAADPRFRHRRASKGGRTRARTYSPLWQQLMMYYVSERRLRRTATANFRAWLLERGLDRVAAEAKQ